MKKRIISLFICLVLCLSLVPTATAAEYFKLTADENLTVYWDEVPGAVKYEVIPRDPHGDVCLLTTTANTYFEMGPQLTSHGFETGTYSVYVIARNASENILCTSEDLYIGYVSPFSKLPAPTGLAWEGTTAKWDAVPGADSYSVVLHRYAPYITAVCTIKGISATSYDFLFDLSDDCGYYFTVSASGDGFRDSSKSESPQKSFGEIPVPAYSVTVNGGFACTDNTGETVITEQKAGKKVFIVQDVPEGKEFDGWIVNSPSGLTLSEMLPSYFTMPAGNVKVTARFRDSGPFTELSATIVAPKRGYGPEYSASTLWNGYTAEVLTWYVVSDDGSLKSINETFVFKVGKKYCARVCFTPASDVTFDPDAAVTVNGLPAGSPMSGPSDGQRSYLVEFPVIEPFKDVKPDSWYSEAVNYCADRGIVGGYEDGTFKPNNKMTRAELVTVLWRTEGSPEVKFTERFSDVKSTSWFKNAVLWAAKNGIVNGMTESTFAPNGVITREQIAAIFFRYAEFKGVSTEARSETLKDFPDYGKIHDYAIDPISWANATGLIGGNNIGGVNMIDPRGNATRAQVATILMRFCEKQ